MRTVASKSILKPQTIYVRLDHKIGSNRLTKNSAHNYNVVRKTQKKITFISHGQRLREQSGNTACNSELIVVLHGVQKNLQLMKHGCEIKPNQISLRDTDLFMIRRDEYEKFDDDGAYSAFITLKEPK